MANSRNIKVDDSPGVRVPLHHGGSARCECIWVYCSIIASKNRSIFFPSVPITNIIRNKPRVPNVQLQVLVRYSWNTDGASTAIITRLYSDICALYVGLHIQFNCYWFCTNSAVIDLNTWYSLPVGTIISLWIIVITSCN